MQFPILDGLWVENSMDYVNGSMKKERIDFIFVVIERYLKIIFVDSHTTNLFFHGSCTLASSAQNNYK